MGCTLYEFVIRPVLFLWRMDLLYAPEDIGCMWCAQDMFLNDHHYNDRWLCCIQGRSLCSTCWIHSQDKIHFIVSWLVLSNAFTWCECVRQVCQCSIQSLVLNHSSFHFRSIFYLIYKMAMNKLGGLGRFGNEYNTAFHYHCTRSWSGHTWIIEIQYTWLPVFS